MDPSLLNGAGAEFITEEGGAEPIPREYIYDCYLEYLPLLIYLTDLDNGIFRITEEDYKRKPASLIAAYKLYKNLTVTKRTEKEDFYKKLLDGKK